MISKLHARDGARIIERRIRRCTARDAHASRQGVRCTVAVRKAFGRLAMFAAGIHTIGLNFGLTETPDGTCRTLCFMSREVPLLSVAAKSRSKPSPRSLAPASRFRLLSTSRFRWI
ncbi:hypothetical protein BN2476_230339 [Paraburkholderia piptadeniae]|uniref:Uncharacterized protein n=2 Tax=Paraburkholderia piptadeniae TaxID=1701573 RepID=A0A1N7RZ61_9BURK|nr:hypothetical protein BN2476_230339 [Paraburkholderia piptadeniae]